MDPRFPLHGDFVNFRYFRLCSTDTFLIKSLAQDLDFTVPYDWTSLDYMAVLIISIVL